MINFQYHELKNGNYGIFEVTTIKHFGEDESFRYRLGEVKTIKEARKITIELNKLLNDCMFIKKESELWKNEALLGRETIRGLTKELEHYIKKSDKLSDKLKKADKFIKIKIKEKEEDLNE